MRDADQIIALRRAGKKPAMVWVSDLPYPGRLTLEVNVHGDTPELLDFRFLVGLTVSLDGEDAERLARLEAAIKPIAQRVVTKLFQGDSVVRITDTEGLATWS